MIVYITGKLTYKEPRRIIVEVGGLGYEVNISLHTFSQIKELETCKLLTHLHIKEDAHVLYGFMNMAEKDWFLRLSSLSVVSPSIAMAALSSFTPAELQQAILHEDISLIKSVKGIGDKTAQRICFELKGQVSKMAAIDLSSGRSGDKHLYQEGVTALIALGVHKNIAEKTIHTILGQYQNNISLEALIKLALKTTQKSKIDTVESFF